MEQAIHVDPGRVIRRFSSHAEQETATQLYWASRSIAEKMTAVAELVRDGYLLRGIDIYAEGSDRVIRRVQRLRS